MKAITHTLAGSGLALFGLMAGAQDVPSKEIALDIKPQPMVDALNGWAQQTGFQIIVPDECAANKIDAPRVRGRLTAQAALSKLLAGTPLTYEFVNERTVAIHEQLPVLLSARTPAVGKQFDRRFVRVAAAQVEEERRASEGGAAESESRAIAAANAREVENNRRQRGVLEEVIVTAQKRAERIIDVPMSITALSREKLSVAHISNTLDLSFAVPSLSVAETGPGRQILSVRGISGYRGSSSLIGVYLDDVPLTGAQDGFVASYADARVLDLERIEVLKGPQGTLFGEGSVGGTIRFITRDPDLSRLGGEISTEVSNTADGDWSGKVIGVGNFPLAEDLLGIRVAATYENTSGWIDQPSIDREDINDSELWHVRLKALYAPTPQLTVKGLVEIHRNEGGASNVVNQTPLEDSIFVQGPVRDLPTDFRDDYNLYNLSLTYDFGFAELLISTSHEEFDSVQSFTQLLGTLPTPWMEIALPAYGKDETITAQELRLTSATESPFKWTLGGSYKDDELIHSWGPEGFYGNFGGGAVQVRQVAAGEMPTSASESWAVFGDASFKLFDRLEIGGGLRYFSDRREKFEPTLPALGKQSGSFDKLTWRSYVKFDLAQDVNVYASAATGFRSGGFNAPSNVQFGAPATFDPENSIFYETGTKMSLLDGRVHLYAAAFYGEFEDMLQDIVVPSALSPTGAVQFTANGQSAEIKGLEGELRWVATDRLTLSIAADVTDTEITDIDPTNTVFEVGDPIDRVPEYSLSASADYRFHWTQSMPGYVVIGFNRKGEQVTTNRSVAGIVLETVVTTPPLDFLNANLGAEWNGWMWNVFGTNLLDESGLLFPTEWGFSAQARPRTFGVSVHKEF